MKKKQHQSMTEPLASKLDRMLDELTQCNHAIESTLKEEQAFSFPQHQHDSSLLSLTDSLVQKISQIRKQANNGSNPDQTHVIQHILERVQQDFSKAIHLVQQKKTSKDDGQHALTTQKSSHYNIENYFPHSFSKINQLSYDSQEGLSYLTPHRDAFEIATILLEKLCHLSTHPRKSNDYSTHASYPLHIIDGTGGLGGNTIGFLRALWKLYPSQVLNQTRMTMIELDAKRYECGKHNVELFVNDFNEKNRAVSCEFHAVNDNFLTWWNEWKNSITENSSHHAKSIQSESIGRSAISVDSSQLPLSKTFIFFDPPWGNEDYSQHSVIEDLYFLKPTTTIDPATTSNSHTNVGGTSATSQSTNPSECSSSSNTHHFRLASVKQITRALLNDDRVQGVALKVPFNFSESSDDFAKHCHVEYVVMKKVKYLLVLPKKVVYH